MRTFSTKKLTFAAILIALGILIPMVMPKVTIGPASFTLASHVPVFLAMFISPGVAVAVALGTAFGFFMTLPVVVAFRALSHLVFAIIGALVLQKKPTIVSTMWQFQIFNLIIGLIHAAVELLVVSVFFLQGSMSEATYSQGYFYAIFLLVGLGGLVHSLIDYNLAYFLGQRLSQHFDFPVFTESQRTIKQGKVVTNH